MADAFADPERIEGYHAHIYYDPATRAKAERLRQGIGERFAAKLGNWHDEPVGPHPVSMYQVAFAVAEVSATGAVADAEPRRARCPGAPAAGDSVADHTRFAMWLGQALPLRLETLRRASGAG